MLLSRWHRLGSDLAGTECVCERNQEKRVTNISRPAVGEISCFSCAEVPGYVPLPTCVWESTWGAGMCRDADLNCDDAGDAVACSLLTGCGWRPEEAGDSGSGQCSLTGGTNAPVARPLYQFEARHPTNTSDRKCESCSTCGAGNRTAAVCTPSADTVCDLCPACGVGQFATQSCTDTEPPICTTCRACVTGTYRASGCTGSDDSDCRRCSLCAPVGEEFQSRGCSAEADRICSPVEPLCEDGFYESATPTSTTNRVCSPITAGCGVDEFQEAPPKRSPDGRMFTADRKCATTLSCAELPCPGGERSAFEVKAPSNTTNRQCKCPRVCDPGTSEATPPNTTADRVCLTCAVGTFQPLPGQTKCLPVLECADDSQFEAEEATPQSDRVCAAVSAPCTRDSYEFAQPTNTSDRICKPYQECLEGQWENTAPTLTSDRGCASHLPCGEGQFEKDQPDATSDRSCAALTICRAKQYEDSAPAPADQPVTDRGCSDVTRCTADEFEEEAPTLTSDRRCTALNICGPSEYTVAAGSRTADRVCEVVTNCSALNPVGFELLPPTSSTDRVCGTATLCIAGSYELKPPTTSADRICADCDGLTGFQDLQGQLACKPVTACDPDTQYLATSATALRDAACATKPVCGEGTFGDPNAPSGGYACSTCRVCTGKAEALSSQPITEYEATPCSATNDAVCRNVTNATCPAEEFIAQPATPTSDRECKPHTICSVEQFVNSRGNSTHDTACSSHTLCGPGEHTVALPTPSSDRACAPCIAGSSFALEPNALSCTPCTVCGPGEEVRQQCATGRNTVCRQCQTGTFSSDGTACTQWSQCQPGTVEVVQPSTVGDRVCIMCPNGYWHDPGAAPTACIPHTVCDDGYVGAGQSSSTDRMCSPSTTTTVSSTTGTGTSSTSTRTTHTTRTTTRTQTAYSGEGPDVFDGSGVSPSPRGTPAEQPSTAAAAAADEQNNSAEFTTEYGLWIAIAVIGLLTLAVVGVLLRGRKAGAVSVDTRLPVAALHRPRSAGDELEAFDEVDDEGGAASESPAARSAWGASGSLRVGGHNRGDPELLQFPSGRSQPHPSYPGPPQSSPIGTVGTSVAGLGGTMTTSL